MLIKDTSKALVLYHTISTVIYYKWTESIGMYINWGFLTDEQRVLYFWAATGWFLIMCFWIVILTTNIKTDEQEVINS